MIASSNPLALTVGALLALVTLAGVARGRNLAPILHNASWSGALIIVGSGLIPYPPLSFHAWLLILGSIILFNAVLATRGADKRAKTPSQIHAPPGERSSSFISLSIYRLIVAAYVFGLCVYLSSIASSFGLQALLSDAGSIRQDTSVRYLEAFPIYGKLPFYLGPLAFILTVFPDYVRRTNEPSRFMRLAFSLALLASQAVVLQRTNIFVCLVWLAGVLLIRYEGPSTGATDSLPRRRLLRLASLGVAALIAFQGIAMAVGKTGTDNAQVNSNVSESLQNNPATSILLYWSSGIPALDVLIHSTNSEWPPENSGGAAPYGDWNPQTYGLATAGGASKLIPGVREWNSIAPFVRVPVPTNVYTWMEPWYRDYREAGVLVGTALIALIVRISADRAQRSPRAQCLAGLLIGLTALAPFINRYMTVMSLVLYAAIWVGGRWSGSGRGSIR